MLFKCIRLKRIYIKILFILLIIVFLVIVTSKLAANEHAAIRKRSKLSSNLSNIYEKKLRNYERKIISKLGDNGEPAFLDGKDAKDGENALKTFALNSVLSDRMPLDRKLRDPRNKKCKKFKYNPKLKTSVIVIFYNELMSVILRTIWSVILQTPSHLLEEIILVDDASTEESLNGLLDYYIDTRLNEYSIKLVRLKHRLGLIRARLQGARVAQGDVLIFLDAHCEATVGWAEPLLSRIEEDRTTVLVPIIDVIEATNMAYSTNGDSSFQVGGFSWAGHFTWIDIQNEKDKHRLTPVKSPTMAGGLFAIDRNFFWDIGSYDEQMDGWGGENLEMSFRIWQCGGRLETVPCSRVGHIFRDFHPYSFPDNKDTHGINTARLAHVWMDDYKRLFFMHQPGLENNPIVGDLTHRKQLRQKLRCKSFKWYLDNVYPEKFIPDENVFAYGQVRTDFAMCLDDLQLAEDKVGPLGLYQCHPYLAMSQYFSLSRKGELRKENFCAEVFNERDVQLTECHGRKRQQYWVLYKNGTIFNPISNKCLSSEGVDNGKELKVHVCSGNVYQKWKFDKLGFRRSYDLGTWLRNRYATFLPVDYSPKDIHVFSTDTDRTLMSAEANLAGLYPPKTSDVWNWNLVWRPIPVHTIPRFLDEIITEKRDCQEYNSLHKKAKKLKFFKNINDENAELYQFISKQTGWDVKDIKTISTLRSVLYCYQNYDSALIPSWADELNATLIDYLTGLDYQRYTYTEKMKRLRIGPFFHNLTSHFDKITSHVDDTPKFRMYSGHETSLSAILDAMGVFDLLPIDFSATIIWELKKRSDGSYFVNVFYKRTAGLESLKIPECQFDCDYDQFKKTLRGIIVDPHTWKKECEDDD